MIFVFGSNESGIHGAGAAYTAHKRHGAQNGVGFGPTGQSFAIPTKDWRIGELSLNVIETYIARFIAYAKLKPSETFQVTAIGCGLAGYRHSDIAPLFRLAPSNCLFDLAWKPVLGENFKYWGSFQIQ